MIEDVFNPTTKNAIDPKIEKEKKEADDASYWESKAKGSRAKREFEQEERSAREAQRMEQSPPEPPFQVKGSVDLGHFDMQAQQKELKDTIDRIQSEAQTQLKALGEKSEHYRDEVQKIQIAMVENTLKAQIESMQKMIQDGLAKPKDPNVMERLSEITQIAGVLGYTRPGANDALPSEIRLQMLKMDMDEKQAQRKFEWDKMISDRTWQLELKKLEQSAAQASAQIQVEREKRGMMASPFEAIGVAIARGLIDSGGEIPRATSRPKRKRSIHGLQADEGDSGTVGCPECGEPIAIAPQARSAVCPSCDVTISIDRKPKAGE